MKLYTTVDKEYRVSAHASFEELWKNTLWGERFMDRYADQPVTEEGLKAALNEEGEVNVYLRDAISNGDWHMRVKCHA